MKFKLRDYQQKCVDDAKDRDIIVLSTGAGKSAIICELVRRDVKAGKKPLIVVPSLELKRQFTATLKQQEISGCSVAVYKSAYKHIGIDSYYHDECHRTACNTWDKLISDNLGASHIGTSATPFRLDGRPLKHFKRVLEPILISELIQRGYLAPGIDEYSVDLGVELNDSEDLESQYSALNRNKLYGQVVDNFLKYCDPHSKTIVFATTIKHCEQLQERFESAGIKATTISYKDTFSARKAKLDWFKNGYITMLLNVSLFVEGVDVPDTQNVLLCRYGSCAFYFQAVGRVLRKKSTNAIVLDYVGNIIKHGSVMANTGWSDRFYEELNRPQEVTVPYCTRCYSPVSADVFLKAGKCPICLGTVDIKKSKPTALPSEINGDLKRYSVPLFEQAFYQASKINDWKRYANAMKKALALAEDKDTATQRILEGVSNRYTGRLYRNIEKIILG